MENRHEWFEKRKGQRVYGNKPISYNEYFVGMHKAGYFLDNYSIGELLGFERESSGMLRFFDTKADARSYNKTMQSEETIKRANLNKNAVEMRFVSQIDKDNDLKGWFIRFKSVAAKIIYRKHVM